MGASAGFHASRRRSTTRHGRVHDLCSTLTAQLIKTDSPTRRTVTTVTRLFALVQAARQLVYTPDSATTQSVSVITCHMMYHWIHPNDVHTAYCMKALNPGIASQTSSGVMKSLLTNIASILQHQMDVMSQ